MKQTDNGQIDRRKCLQINFYFFRLSPVACGVLVPQPEIGSMPPALGTWSLNHWTTREVPTNLLIFNITCTGITWKMKKWISKKKKKSWEIWELMYHFNWGILRDIGLLGENKKWQPTPVLLPGKPHGWRSLVGYSPWGCKESDMTEWLHFLFFHKWFLVMIDKWVPRKIDARYDSLWQSFSGCGINF